MGFGRSRPPLLEGLGGARMGGHAHADSHMQGSVCGATLMGYRFGIRRIGGPSGHSF